MTVVKHKDFLTLAKAVKPHVHAKIVAHPDFDAKKHNSLMGAMKLDPKKAPAVTTDECGELADLIGRLPDLPFLREQ